MTEVQQLISFMETGRRKMIVLNEYIRIQKKKGSWNNLRGLNLRRELSLTDHFKISYVRKQIDDESFITETLLIIKPKYTNKRNRSM